MLFPGKSLSINELKMMIELLPESG